MAAEGLVESIQFAKIKWSDYDQEVVAVSRIKKFTPKNLKDFVKDKWYKVKGNKENYTDGKPHSAYALIGALAGTREELENPKRRITFPPVPPPDTDPDSTQTEAEKLNLIYNQKVAEEQENTRKLKAMKQKAHQDSFTKFREAHLNAQVNNVSSKPEAAPGCGPSNVSSKKNTNAKPQSSVTSSQQQNETASLKRRIQELENQLREKDKKLKSTVTSAAELKSHIQTAMKEYLDTHISKYDKSLSDVQEELKTMKTILSKSGNAMRFMRTQNWVEVHYGTSTY